MDDVVIWNVDTQKDFMLKEYGEGGVKTAGKLYVPDAEGIIGNLNSIFEAAAQNNLKIISTADEHFAESKELAKNGGAWPDHCMAGTEGQKSIPETLLDGKSVGIVHWNGGYDVKGLGALLSKQQVILTKDDNDVFHKENGNPYVQHALAKLEQGGDIYVTGVATDYCVKCAVEGLVNALRGMYDRYSGGLGGLYLVTDAVKEIDPKNVAQLKEKWSHLGVQFITTKELLDRIAQKYPLTGGLKAKFKAKGEGAAGIGGKAKKLNYQGPL